MQSTISKNHEMFASIQEWGFWHEIQVGAQKEYAMSKEEFDKLLPEYWKFMGLIAMGHTGLGMFSEAIDKIWHAHILNTRRYEQFCMTIFGRMIHHAPNLDTSKIAQQSFTPDCLEPSPSCKEPDPGPSCKEPDPNPSCAGGEMLYHQVKDIH